MLNTCLIAVGVKNNCCSSKISSCNSTQMFWNTGCQYYDWLTLGSMSYSWYWNNLEIMKQLLKPLLEAGNFAFWICVVVVFIFFINHQVINQAYSVTFYSSGININLSVQVMEDLRISRDVNMTLANESNTSSSWSY